MGEFLWGLWKINGLPLELEGASMGVKGNGWRVHLKSVGDRMGFPGKSTGNLIDIEGSMNGIPCEIDGALMRIPWEV